MTRARTVTCGFASLIVLIVLVAPAAAHAQQMVLLVRHAERADGGAAANPGMSNAPADPALSAAGEARAARLATMLADANIKAIFASEFRRTKDTGAPLAAKLKTPVQSMSAKDTAALVAKLRKDHAKDVVLVIGHSNTIPEVIKALGGPSVTMADDEYSAIYVLNPATGALTLLRY
jgi:broad specificity phosphatase PhoE